MPKASDPIPFELRTLEIFLSVCDSGAMAASARALGLTQPAISQTIADLEAKTGTVLFDRSVRPLALTPAGSVLRQRAAALISEARQIGPLLKESTQGKYALIRVGLVDSLSRALTAPIATLLKTRADAVHIQSGLTATHAGALLTRNLEFFIGVDELTEIAGLQRYELMREPYILLLPHGADAPATVGALRDLARTMPLVRYSARSKTGIEIERHLRRLEVEAAPGYEFDSPYGVHAMVEAGQGFAITTPLCLGEAGISGVSVAPLPGPKLMRTLTLIARRQELGAIARELARSCRSSLSDRPRRQIVARFPWLEPSLAILTDHTVT